MPNPFETNIRLQVYADHAMLTAIRMVDVTGREMYISNRVLAAGNNNISLDLPATLSKGVYVMQLISNHEVIWKQRVEKMR